MQQLVSDAVAAQAQQSNPYLPVPYTGGGGGGSGGAYGPGSAPQETEEVTVNGKRSLLWPALGAAALLVVVMSNNGARRRA